jgi:hypothetical protein
MGCILKFLVVGTSGWSLRLASVDSIACLPISGYSGIFGEEGVKKYFEIAEAANIAPINNIPPNTTVVIPFIKNNL